MPRIAILLLALLALATVAHADERNDQRNWPADTRKAGGTVAKVDADANGGFPAARAMAFIEQAGYLQVTDLERVSDLVWRATAYKDGKAYAIAVDYTGTVVGAN